MQGELTKAQLQLFLDHIGLPEHYRGMAPCPELLKALHVHTMSSLPYENLTLHYNPARYIDLEPKHLFDTCSRRWSRKSAGGADTALR